TGMNIQHLTIIDAQGKILQQFNPNDNLRGISTASLQPGVFFLEINDGRNRYYRQFLKEK
ncbi:MAG: T9SS type A sorting domain-containing protein, partial [Bacteroidota bacterium]